MTVRRQKNIVPGPGQRSLDELFEYEKDVKSRYKRRTWVERIELGGRNGMRMKFLLRIIEGRDRDNIGCTLYVETIAKEMSASRRTVLRAIQDCVAAGLLYYEGKRCKDHPSFFAIRFETVAQVIVNSPKTIGLIAPREAKPHVTLAPVTCDTCADSHVTLVESTCDTSGGSHVTDAEVTCDTCAAEDAASDNIDRARVLKPQLNLEEKPLVKPAFPAELDCPEFSAAWQKWLQHHEELRRPLTSVAAAQQLAKLAAWGLMRAIGAIEHSLGNGWVGIFEPNVRSEVAASNQPGPGQKYDPTAVVGEM